MGIRGWLFVFVLMIVLVFITIAMMKWLQNAATSVPPTKRRKDEDENG